jgi:CheY-like chemotaxis protein
MINQIAKEAIVIAEDDPDDCLLIREALEQMNMIDQVRFVGDGEELLKYLRAKGGGTTADRVWPRLVLLDLNMPRRDGREVLVEMKKDTMLRSIPVVILTTSQAEEDMGLCYALGANAYLVKPITFEGLVGTLRSLIDYWLDFACFATRPPRGRQDD